MAEKSKGELTAEKILDATAHCIATHGIEKSSITRISEEAGVSRGLVAHYFPKKSKIFIRVILHIVEMAYAELGSIKSTPNSRSELREVMTRNLDFFLTRPDYLKCFVLFYYFCGVDRSARSLNTKLTTTGRKRIEVALKSAGISRKDLARSLHTKMVGAILQFYAVNEGLSRQDFRKRFIDEIEDEIRG
jgi:AcrR family transcriptional regulator